MNHFPAVIRLMLRLISALIVFFILTAQTPTNSSNHELTIPDSLSKRLDSLRNADNLQEWLVNSIEYLDNKPAERISILYTAESTAWRLPKTNDEKLAWFDLLTNQGYYEMYRGSIVRSIDAYEKAYRYYFDNPLAGAEGDVLEYVLKPLGNNYTRLGDYDRAFFIQEKSLSMALQLKDSIQTASIYHNLATSARWKGDLGLAVNYCEKGLMFIPAPKPRRGLLLSAYGEVLLLQNKSGEAETRMLEAIKILQQNLSPNDKDDINWLRGAYQGYGEILKQKNKPGEALDYYEKAETLLMKYFKGERIREMAKLDVLTGQALLQLNRPAESIGKFNRALTRLIPSFLLNDPADLPNKNDLYAENTILDALNGKASCLMSSGKKEQALGCFMLLFNVERKLRFEFFGLVARQQQQREMRDWVEAAMELAVDLAETTGKDEYMNDALLIAEMSKSQLLVDEMVNNLYYKQLKGGDSLLKKQHRLMQAMVLAQRESILNDENGKRDSNLLKAKDEMQYDFSLLQKEIREKYPFYSQYIAAGEPVINELFRIIPASATVIEYFSGQKNIYTIEVTNNGVKRIQRIQNAKILQERIRTFVFEWYQNGAEKMMNAPEAYRLDAYHVYQLLFGKNETEKGQLIIIPDGIIGYVPFEALITDSVNRSNIEDWPFLVKRSNVFYSYSLQTWEQQQQVSYANHSFAGFFLSFDSSKQGFLPSVKRENELIRKSVPGRFYEDHAASLSQFQKNLDQVNLLHISTHSYLQGAENMPVLQLADDKFFLFELYGRSFQPQLVVLSACRTGHGMLSEGEGIISLARGFTGTGAGGIVAGLWNMNDESTAEIIGSFYKNLSDNYRPADALSLAKKNWLTKDQQQSFKKLPYFWAGMIYVGSNDLIRIQKEKTAMPLVWVAVAVVLVIVAGILYFKLKGKRGGS